MRHPKLIIEKARGLRVLGKTYSEIQRRFKMKIPKSTLSYWCKKIPLPEWYKRKVQHLNEKNLSKAQKMAWVVNKQKQEKLIHKIRQSNVRLKDKLSDKDILKMLLSMLHLGEGAKWKSHRGLYLGSSDSRIIKLYLRLLSICYGIRIDQLRARICYRADQNIKNLQKYWTRVTSIPSKHFYKTKPDPRTVGNVTKKKNYKGVCAISCAGTEIQRELEIIPDIILEGL